MATASHVDVLAAYHAEAVRADEAVKVYRRALADEPRVVALHEGLGRLLWALARSSSAWVEVSTTPSLQENSARERARLE